MAIIRGTIGNDTLIGTLAVDLIFGYAGKDSLLGLAGNDTLNGGFGNDTLNGELGIDILNGGAGDDTYIIDSTNDTINETFNSGIDTVRAARNYILGRNLENLSLTNRAVEGIGNNLNNYMIGNEIDNILRGGAGNDTLNGEDGNDTLYGGAGNDLLIGAVSYATIFGNQGIDVLYGGDNDDTYYISSEDIIIEAANAGIDKVITLETYALGDNLENLELSGPLLRLGTRGIDGTGNSLNNIIDGDVYDNRLEGRAGSDLLNGGAGNDTLVGTANGVGEKDVLTGGLGRDTFLLGNASHVFYDDRNPATPGLNDYALITDFNPNNEIIRLNGKPTDYVLAASPQGTPTGIALYRSDGKSNELIAIIQGNFSKLNLNAGYFRYSSFIDVIDVSELNGSNGFTIRGLEYYDRLGFSVSSAGDINGDGFADIVIGAIGGYPVYNQSKSYVVFGKAEGWNASFDLTTLNGSNGFNIQEIKSFDYLGFSVSSAGDVNGDGFSDLIVSAPDADPNGLNKAGEGYVVFGKASGWSPNFDLTQLNGSNGFTIKGINSSTRLGFSVSNAGDVNGDGFSDLIVGSGENATETYVVFGKASSWNANVNVANLNGRNGFALTVNDAFNFFGSSVSGAGDINGDGFADLIVGSPFAGQNQTGESYVVFGKASGWNANVNVANLNGRNGFILKGIANSRFGISVSNAGDVNGDGFTDLIVGASFASPNGKTEAGESYVVFGKAGGFAAQIDVANLNGRNGFAIAGINPGDLAGVSVGGAGDINGDGFDDLLVRASHIYAYSPDAIDDTYVIFGTQSFSARLNLSALNGRNGFAIKGEANGLYEGGNELVRAAGDINGDGFADIITSTPRGGGAENGRSYIVFGKDFSHKVTKNGTAGNDILTGTAGDDILIGGRGNDTLRGGLGRDVLYGGAGDDILSFGKNDRRLDGGSGTDTLAVFTAGVTIDLTTTTSSQLRGFEIIDLTGTGNNSLKLTRLDLLNLSDTSNQLIVKGNAGDRVTFTGEGWLFGGQTTFSETLYDCYTSGAATLLVDTNITQTIN